MKTAFLFLIMTRTLQFFVGNQGSRRYVKGFIAMITIVIIMQSFLGNSYDQRSLEDTVSQAFDQLSDFEMDYFPLPPELQMEAWSEEVNEIEEE